MGPFYAVVGAARAFLLTAPNCTLIWTHLAGQSTLRLSSRREAPVIPLPFFPPPRRNYAVINALLRWPLWCFSESNLYLHIIIVREEEMEDSATAFKRIMSNTRGGSSLLIWHVCQTKRNRLRELAWFYSTVAGFIRNTTSGFLQNL